MIRKVWTRIVDAILAPLYDDDDPYARARGLLK